VLVTEQLPGTRIQFAAPAGRVTRLLEGRLLSLLPGAAAQTPQGAMLPITAQMADPLDHVRKLALVVWAGLPGSPRPSPGTTQPAAERGDEPPRTFAVRLSDDPQPAGEGRIGEGEIVIPSLPGNKVLWVRPHYTDADGTERWGEAISLGRPAAHIERAPATLHNQPGEAGRVAVRYHYTERANNRTSARPEVTVELPNSSGDPRVAQAQRAQTALTIPIPDRELSPGATWDGTVRLRSEGQVAKPEAEVTLAMRYRYLGRGRRGGREEALVELSGRPAPGQDVVGEVHGYAWIDTETGRMTLARTHFDVSAPVPGTDKAPARVHFTLQVAVSVVDGPAPKFDLSPLPPDFPVMVPVIVR
jgi:hypothetical protein